MSTNEYQEIDEPHFNKPRVIHRIIRMLADYEEAFKAGNQASLFAAICLCSQYQAVIPAWAADAILQGKTDLNAGECEDFNALFGLDLPKLIDRQREAKIQKYSETVLEMLVKYRCDGGNLSADEAFGFVSEQTGLPRRHARQSLAW